MEARGEGNFQRVNRQTCVWQTENILFFPLEPCPPTGVSSSMNCLSNIAVVSWTSSAGAAFYTATVTQDDGQSLSCWSDSEQCGMPNVHCGQNYTVTVVASNGNCNSDPSEENTLQSGENLSTELLPVLVSITMATPGLIRCLSCSSPVCSY